MYKIYATKSGQTICIHNDEFASDDSKVSSPSLSLVESNAGELSLKLPPINVGYDFIDRLDTELFVKQGDTEIWRGRVLTIKEDFYKNKTIKCEGELAYLNDTTQPQQELTNMTPAEKLTEILNQHNSKSSKKYYTGIVTVTDPSDTSTDYTNYDSTMSCISSKLVDKFGGYIHLRKVSGTNYIDYLREADRPTAAQDVRFGDNLLDFTKSFDSTDFCTVVLPLGKQTGTEYADDGTSLGTYVTIESVNNNSPYLINQSAVDRFGWIEKVVNYNDIEDPEELMMYGELYLSAAQFDNMVLEVNAVDLAYMGAAPDNIHLSDSVHVESAPHGLSRYFPVTKITIPLDHPENTSFTMGTEVNISMSARSINDSNSINDKLSSFSQYISTSMDENVLAQARAQADQIIKTHTRGYITITTATDSSGVRTDALYITDQPLEDGYNPDDETSKVSKYWIWDMGGLGFYNRQDPGSGLRIALTNDGKINADSITTGTLNAARIKAGILTDKAGKFSLNMTTGALTMASGTFTGELTAGNTTGANGTTGLKVGPSGIWWHDIYSSKKYDGTLTLKNATISGTINLGGYSGTSGNGGVLNLYDESNMLRFQLTAGGGLYSYGKSVNGAREFEVHYGYCGSLTAFDHYDGGAIIVPEDPGPQPVEVEIAAGATLGTKWFSNAITFSEVNGSPFAWFGIGSGGKMLYIRNINDAINIQSNDEIQIIASEEITIMSDYKINIVSPNVKINGKEFPPNSYLGTKRIPYRGSKASSISYMTFVNGVLTDVEEAT